MAGEGLQVIVKPGLAWFDHTWNQNDASMPLSLSPADVTLTRYDAVVLEVNSADRTNAIKIVTGTAAVSPAKPALANTETLHQHPLAYVKVAGGATADHATDIEITVGTRLPVPLSPAFYPQPASRCCFKAGKRTSRRGLTTCKRKWKAMSRPIFRIRSMN